MKREEAKQKSIKKQRLMEILEEKEDMELKNLSPEELKKKIEEL
jgi:hypothetical protein